MVIYSDLNEAPVRIVIIAYIVVPSKEVVILDLLIVLFNFKASPVQIQEVALVLQVLRQLGLSEHLELIPVLGLVDDLLQRDPFVLDAVCSSLDITVALLSLFRRVLVAVELKDLLHFRKELLRSWVSVEGHRGAVRVEADVLVGDYLMDRVVHGAVTETWASVHHFAHVEAIESYERS
jgi:hypothetical protein